MIDSMTLYNSEFHNVKLKATDGKEYEGKVILYESEWDSDSGEAEISLCGTWFKQSEIELIEIIDDD